MKQLRSLFMQRWTLQTLQTTFDLTMLPFLLQYLQVWRLACTGAWKRDRSKRRASFGVWLCSPPYRFRDINTGGQAFNRWGRASSGARFGRRLATGAPENQDSEIFQGLAIHAKGLTVPSVHNPGIYDTDICKQTQVPSLGLHGGVVEVYQHVTIINAPHVGIITPDDRSQAPSSWSHCSTWWLRTSAPPPCLLTAEWLFCCPSIWWPVSHHHW